MRIISCLDRFKLHIFRKILSSIFCLLFFICIVATTSLRSTAAPEEFYNKSFVLPAGTSLHANGKKVRFKRNVNMTVRGHQMFDDRPFYTVLQNGSPTAYAIDSKVLSQIPGFENCSSQIGGVTKTARQVTEITRKAQRTSRQSGNIATFASPIQTSGCYISSNEGFRTDPKGKGTRHHDGCDFAAGRGTPVLAASTGLVINTITGRSRDGEGYGNQTYILHFPPRKEKLMQELQKAFQNLSYEQIRKYLLHNPIQIKLANGTVLNNMISVSSHLQKVTKGKGSIVQKGETVATVNRTGRNTGDHLLISS